MIPSTSGTPGNVLAEMRGRESHCPLSTVLSVTRLPEVLNKRVSHLERQLIRISELDAKLEEVQADFGQRLTSSKIEWSTRLRIISNPPLLQWTT